MIPTSSGREWVCQVVLVVKNLTANARDIRDAGLTLGWEDPWRKAWQLTLVFLPGESHGQRSLARYGPRDCKAMTEATQHSTAHSVRRAEHQEKEVFLRLPWALNLSNNTENLCPAYTL